MTKGIIEVRKCPACGHHEIGVRIQDINKFVPLIPGQKVYIETRTNSDTESAGDNVTGAVRE